MSDQSVSEELVEIAAAAIYSESTPDYQTAVRRGIEAIAPRLKAEGLREAARMVNPDKYPTSNYAGLWEYRILARADALDPPKETK